MQLRPGEEHPADLGPHLHAGGTILIILVGGRRVEGIDGERLLFDGFRGPLFGGLRGRRLQAWC